MTFFFWYQEKGETKWQLGQSTNREVLIQNKQPKFVTVLDASAVPEDGWSKIDYLNMKYQGPFYMDWDAEELEHAIADFQTTLDKLKEDGVDLDCCNLYATGGHGFHIEIPPEVFIDKSVNKGIPQLPLIYREMALEYSTPSTDMRVYSTRRGRMWRTPNVQRSNGKYKVQLTTREAFAMTPELYEELTAAPRYNVRTSQPTFNMELAVKFSSAKSKVDRQISVRRRAKDESEALRKYADGIPPAAKAVAGGYGYNPDKGFNQIAMQLAITYSAAGKTEEEFLADCDGFIQKHKGDGSRYNSPRKRKEALQEMFHYIDGCDLYSYSEAGLRNILDADSGLDVGIETEGYTAFDASEEAQTEHEEKMNSFYRNFKRFRGVYLRRSGIYQKGKGDEGDDVLCNAGFSNVKMGRDPVKGHVTSLVADIWNGSTKYPRRAMPLDAFSTTRNLDDFLSQFSCNFTGKEQTSTIVRQILLETAEKEQDVIYTCHREGMDVISVRDDSVEGGMLKVRAWVTPYGVWSNDPRLPETASFQFVAPLATTSSYNTDILDLPYEPLDEQDKAWLHKLMHINRPGVVGVMLGWFMAVFQKQLFHEMRGQFPMLHPVGQAGAGKTQTSELFNRLFYHNTRPNMLSAGPTTTMFAIKAALVSSASVPLVLDEYKPREMGAVRHRQLLQILRGAYNQLDIATGGVLDGSAKSTFRDITRLSTSAPVCYIGEAEEDQAAMLERSICVYFTKASANRDNWEAVYDEGYRMSRLGRCILEYVMQEPVKVFEERFLSLQSKVRQVSKEYNINLLPRVEFNIIAVMCGLHLFKAVVDQHFTQGEFDEDLEPLTRAVLENYIHRAPTVTPEYARTLTHIATNTRMVPLGEEFCIEEGRDYMYTEDGEFLEIAMCDVYKRLCQWAQRINGEVLYNSETAFVNAYAHLPHLVVDIQCPNSPLRARVGMVTPVYRFNVRQMQVEDIDLPKSKLLNLGA